MQFLNCTFGLVEVFLLLAMVVGLFEAMRAVVANRYIDLSYHYEAVLTMQRVIDSAFLFGLLTALCILPALAISSYITKKISRAILTLFISTSISAVLSASLYFAFYFLSGKGELPFFCKDIDCVHAFLYRVAVTKLELSYYLPMFLIAGAGLFVFSVFVSLGLRKKDVSVNWERLFVPGNKRRIATWCLILLPALIIHLAVYIVAPRLNQDAPNILLVSIDTLRADSLGCKGAPIHMPNIDQVAKQGTDFSNTYSTSPWTLPAHGSLMTSALPDDIGLQLVNDRLDEKWLTLPEVLEQSGYRTGAVVNHLFVSRAYGFGQGFSFFEFFEKADANKNATTLSLKFIEQTKGPWFCFLHFFDPHWPYTPIAPKTLARFTGADRITLAENQDSYRFYKVAIGASGEAVAELKKAYWKEVESVDRQLGQIFARLSVLGELENTIIVITSDHGEGFGERGLFGHGYFLSEEVLQVPLIFRYPKTISGQQILNDRVDIRDVAPSILALAQLPEQAQFTGRNLFGSPPKNLPALSPLVVRTYLTVEPASAVLWDRWKYISPLTASFRDLHVSRTERLFLINGGQGESKDLARLKPDLLVKLRLVSKGEKLAEAGNGAKTALTQSEKENLESLGYLK